MTAHTVWHGTSTDTFALLQALARNCTCEITSTGLRVGVCAPHEMLAHDQRALDGLLWARHIAARLMREEFAA